ncbi:hypothetical protein OLEAN_C08490 [Oleispira antarctica RB-8]|uniref:Uncharacterized protein n=1 Tax=Oleispira antarctica RB-8 TaxID=698738 RepID=R4YKY5_OLEAN|nr:hypothetical protein OLEAN_C08490 [Oleispira antarctica RB-8]
MITLKELLTLGPLAVLIFSGIAYYFGGKGWAIGVAVLLIIGMIGNLIEILKNKFQQSETNSDSIISTSYYSDDDIDYEEDEVEETKPRNKYIDKIQFEYRTASGNKQTYTVLVYKGLRGDLEGWCIERDGIRTFLPERIVNKEVTKLDTGEVLTLKDWRASFRNSKVS